MAYLISELMNVAGIAIPIHDAHSQTKLDMSLLNIKKNWINFVFNSFNSYKNLNSKPNIAVLTKHTNFYIYLTICLTIRPSSWATCMERKVRATRTKVCTESKPASKLQIPGIMI